MSNPLNAQEARMLEQLFASNSHDNLTRGGGQGQAQLIKVDLIDEDADQPRKCFNQDELEGLAASIRDIGVIHQSASARPSKDAISRFLAPDACGQQN